MQRSRKPFVVPVFLPHAGCPHRCVFCNQQAISGRHSIRPTLAKVETVIDQFLGYGGDRRGPAQIAFFGGNFLGQTQADILSLLTLAQRFVRSGRADAIRFSTRPDTVDRQRLDAIAGFAVRTVELGVQSMHSEVLALSKRGHSAEQTVTAVENLKQRGYGVGLQMMVGLPGDTKERALETAREMAELRPDFVRIYPTVVLDHSALAFDYRLGRYRPLTLDVAVDWVKRIFLVFRRRGIPVVRMGLQASADLENGGAILAGPYHAAFGHLVHAALFLDMARRLLLNGDRGGTVIRFSIHPHSISRLQGLNCSNIEALCGQFDLQRLEIETNPALPVDALGLAGTSCMLSYEKLDRAVPAFIAASR